MSTSNTPAGYALPERLEAALEPVLAYWEGLKRPGASIPYWDDLDMARLAASRDRLLLLDVFEGPQRFRFSIVGAAVAQAAHDALEDRFVDAVPEEGPLGGLAGQCAATVAASRPTYFGQAASTDGKGFARILLPMWGNGQVQMLLGAVTGGAVDGAG